MKIDLYLVRHAESEINKNKLKFFKQDPHITEKGVKQCKELKEYIKKNILQKKNIKCYCSILLRTQETSLLSIPRKKIYISNYLKEIENNFQNKLNLKLGNYPTRNIEKQKERLRKFLNTHSINRLKFLDSDMIDKNNNYQKNIYNQRGDLNIFLEKNKENFKNNNIIIIFCHSNIIKNFLNRKEKLKNCSLIHVYNNKDKLFDINKIKNKKEYDILFEPSL